MSDLAFCDPDHKPLSSFNEVCNLWVLWFIPGTIETKHIYKHIKTKFYIWPANGYEVGVQGQVYWLWVEDLLISLVLHNPDDVDSTNYFGCISSFHLTKRSFWQPIVGPMCAWMLTHDQLNETLGWFCIAQINTFGPFPNNQQYAGNYNNVYTMKSIIGDTTQDWVGWAQMIIKTHWKFCFNEIPPFEKWRGLMHMLEGNTILQAHHQKMMYGRPFTFDTEREGFEML
ncbi:unnamed protein product [Eretmochelys imbricata]